MTKVEWPLRKYSAIPPLHYLLDCCYDMLTYSFHANRHYGVQYLNCAVHSLITTSQRLCLVSTIPLPFFRSVATVAVAGENGNAGNPFSYRWMKWPERWLVVDQRQNGKKRIRSYCYGTASAQWIFSRKQRNSYGIYVTGMAKRQCRTATEWWKPGISVVLTSFHIHSPDGDLLHNAAMERFVV